jgi:hypothetical protein
MSASADAPASAATSVYTNPLRAAPVGGTAAAAASAAVGVGSSLAATNPTTVHIMDAFGRLSSTQLPYVDPRSLDPASWCYYLYTVDAVPNGEPEGRWAVVCEDRLESAIEVVMRGRAFEVGFASAAESAAAAAGGRGGGVGAGNVAALTGGCTYFNVWGPVANFQSPESRVLERAAEEEVIMTPEEQAGRAVSSPIQPASLSNILAGSCDGGGGGGGASGSRGVQKPGLRSNSLRRSHGMPSLNVASSHHGRLVVRF